jgi:hypothetical protein
LWSTGEFGLNIFGQMLDIIFLEMSTKYLPVGAEHLSSRHEFSDDEISRRF